MSRKDIYGLEDSSGTWMEGRLLNHSDNPVRVCNEEKGCTDVPPGGSSPKGVDYDYYLDGCACYKIGWITVVSRFGTGTIDKKFRTQVPISNCYNN